MAVEGLEIAPGGIGSGEAQVAKTPFTEKAFMYRVESDRLRKAKEEEAFANELSKIDLDGIHTQDAEDINKKYQELIDSYASVSKAKGRNDRLTSKVLYEQKKKDLLGAISGSKEFNKQLAEIGSKIIGSRDEWEDNSLEMFNQYKKNKSFGVTIDETQFRKKAKPEDILKVKSDVLEFARVPVKENIVVTKGGKQGTMVQETITLDPARYSTAMAYKIQQSPTYKSTLIAQYKSDYEKSPNYLKDAGDADILNYAIEREYQTDLATEKKKKQEGGFNQFYEKNDNQTNFNFGGGGSPTPVANLSQNKVGDDVYVQKVTTPQGGEAKIEMFVPTLDEVRFNSTIDIQPKAYFKNGKLVKDNKTQINGQTIGYFTKPVVVNKNGEPELWAEKRVTVDSQGNRKERLSADVNPENVYEVAFVRVQPKIGQPVDIPLAEMPANIANSKQVLAATSEFLKRNSIFELPTERKKKGGSQGSQRSGQTEADKLNLN
jgi:hypothetical protein